MLDILKVDNGRCVLLCTIYTFKQFRLSVNSQQCRHLLPLDNGRICFHFSLFYYRINYRIIPSSTSSTWSRSPLWCFVFIHVCTEGRNRWLLMILHWCKVISMGFLQQGQRTLLSLQANRSCQEFVHLSSLKQENKHTLVNCTMCH